MAILFESSRRGRPPQLKRNAMRSFDMRKDLNFSRAIKNPYAELLTKPFTVRLDEDSIAYFQEYAREVGIRGRVCSVTICERARMKSTDCPSNCLKNHNLNYMIATSGRRISSLQCSTGGR